MIIFRGEEDVTLLVFLLKVPYLFVKVREVKYIINKIPHSLGVCPTVCFSLNFVKVFNYLTDS